MLMEFLKNYQSGKSLVSCKQNWTQMMKVMLMALFFSARIEERTALIFFVLYFDLDLNITLTVFLRISLKANRRIEP